MFGQALQGYREMPVVSGSLVSDRIIIHGSDLVHDEGRTLGNYMSIFLHCKDVGDRESLIGKLGYTRKDPVDTRDSGQKLVEVTDPFDVRWVLGV